jgi:hypothetical protein
MTRSMSIAVLADIGSAAIVFSFFIAVWIIIAGLWLWALIEVLSWPRSTWDAAGVTRVRWVLRIWILGGIGAVWYFSSARGALKEAYDATRWAGNGGRT